MTEFPAEFNKRMEKLLGEEYSQFEKSCQEDRVQGLRVNLLKTDRDSFVKRFEGFGLGQVPWGEDGFF